MAIHRPSQGAVGRMRVVRFFLRLAIRVSGRDAISRIQHFHSLTVSDMSIGQIRYSVKPNAQGRVRSDLTLWRYSEDVFEIMSGCAKNLSDL
jgi:glycine cleavage system aminomethyltransferase T